jgi:hypothetical protein
MIRSATHFGKKWYKINVDWSVERRQEMLQWCEAHESQDLFYPSVSWWGFENEADATLFILR